MIVIFDIDGTLTRTNEIDDDCFARAAREVCGFEDVDTDWTTYAEVTDTGIFAELFAHRLSRAPHPEETAAMIARFCEHLGAADDEAFAEIPGANAFLRRVREQYDVALATGAWRASALHKLRRAGIDVDGIAAAFADDAYSRADIIRLARERAGGGSAVYVGDGVWDARAAKQLGIPMIGIGEGERAERLLREGAVAVFADHRDGDAILEVIARQA